MKNPKVQCGIAALLLIAVGLLLIPSLTQANPKGVPAWQDRQTGEPQRDGYSRSFVVDANSVLLEVPEGRRYVLLRLLVKTNDLAPPYFEYWPEMKPFWTLTLDGEMLFDDNSLYKIYYGEGTSLSVHDDIREDFPDQCVVVNGGQMLAISKPAEVDRLNVTLIGYFCDAR